VISILAPNGMLVAALAPISTNASAQGISSDCRAVSLKYQEMFDARLRAGLP